MIACAVKSRSRSAEITVENAARYLRNSSGAPARRPEPRRRGGQITFHHEGSTILCSRIVHSRKPSRFSAVKRGIFGTARGVPASAEPTAIFNGPLKAMHQRANLRGISVQRFAEDEQLRYPSSCPVGRKPQDADAVVVLGRNNESGLTVLLKRANVTETAARR
jgi:hypothetical protein